MGLVSQLMRNPKSTGGNMDSCMEVMRRLADFYQGDLSSREAQLIRTHIAQCPYCRVVSDSAAQTLRAFETQFGLEITPQPQRS